MNIFDFKYEDYIKVDEEILILYEEMPIIRIPIGIYPRQSALKRFIKYIEKNCEGNTEDSYADWFINCNTNISFVFDDNGEQNIDIIGRNGVYFKRECEGVIAIFSSYFINIYDENNNEYYNKVKPIINKINGIHRYAIGNSPDNYIILSNINNIDMLNIELDYELIVAIIDKPYYNNIKKIINNIDDNTKKIINEIPFYFMKSFMNV